ncbi:hypothetical protein HAZT_HAZT004793 [Hyalella azteca]|uniref:Bridge-like lipid transfer protein family member 1 C-terminal domain-containing protein n=1 Tax=Hyalella azteca TaxID=294128 RepID=A0A6A0H1K4_HYAAZ|nr:hypothetical protein HAZT_HAZT004793 [Hyalella azteca]
MFTASEVLSESGEGGTVVPGGQYSSFPVDVIVYFHMHPCTIRFSCQPVSRVECLLQLPSLDLVFSSKRANDECTFEEVSTTTSAESKTLSNTVGGLSVTGVLEDFSLFVFHPYGGKTARKSIDSERRNSLSVTVEFVKFQISRTRKMNVTENVNTATSAERLGKQTPNAVPDAAAIIRFSAIIDIGTALFKYDMRRLTEILAFPKAWYRRTIVRRLFLGDLGNLSTVNEMTEDDEVNLTATHSSSTSKDSTENSRRESSNSNNIITNSNNSRNQTTAAAGATAAKAGPESQHPTPGLGPRPRDKLWLNLDGEAAKKSQKTANYSLKSNPNAGGNAGSWETLVLFAANFTKLDVHMNMGNVMGNVVWTTRGFQANGRLSIGSCGHKNMYIGLGLGGSNLEAKGGIVGGIIDLSTINTYLKIREDPGTEPDHTFGVKLFACQCRLDYMGTSVLMLRVSSCGATLRDEWKVLSSDDSDDATRRSATIFIIGDLEWDQLQLLISKSTTADLLKMYHKLEEFFAQQFKSSRQVLFSLQPNKQKHSVRSRDKGGHSSKKLSSGSNCSSPCRLLSWAAKNLDPYGVDYILNKLGFSQASTTIPKWLQRGCMDPLDKLLSLLMFRVITALRDRDYSADPDH